MWNWIEQYHLGRLTSEERLAEEEQHRRLVRFSRFGQLRLVWRARYRSSRSVDRP